MVFGIKGCATAHSIAHKSRQKNVEHAKKMSMSWHNANGKSISYKNFVFILCKKLLFQTMAFRAAKKREKSGKKFSLVCLLLSRSFTDPYYTGNFLPCKHFLFFLHPSTYPILPSHSKPIHLRSHANKIHFCDLFQFFLMLSYIYQQHFIANIHVTMVSVSIYAK